jgi:hypothetical protein
VAGRSPRLGWPVPLRLLALGGTGYAIQATLFFNALSRIPAGMAALLYLYPALLTSSPPCTAGIPAAPRERCWLTQHLGGFLFRRPPPGSPLV